MTLNQYRGIIFAGGVYHRIRYCLPVTCIHWRHADCEELTSPIYPCLLGFPVSISKCSDGSQDSKLPLHEKHVVATPLPPSYLGPNIFLNTLFPDTLSLRSSLNMSDQVSHPYKATGKIIVLYILIFKFVYMANWKTKDSAPNDSKHSLSSVSCFVL